MQLEKNILEEVKSGLPRKRFARLMKVKEGQFPIGVNFSCPFCNYISKQNRLGTARIYPNGIFKCFACGIARRVNDGCTQRRL